MTGPIKYPVKELKDISSPGVIIPSRTKDVPAQNNIAENNPENNPDAAPRFSPYIPEFQPVRVNVTNRSSVFKFA